MIGDRVSSGGRTSPCELVRTTSSRMQGVETFLDRDRPELTLPRRRTSRIVQTIEKLERGLRLLRDELLPREAFHGIIDVEEGWSWPHPKIQA